jgi:hypothetical protein
MPDNKKFLQQIIPDGGRYVGFIAGATKGTGRNISATSVAELVEKLMQANEQGRNVYFAPAAYGEGARRTKLDVMSIRALWFDIDAHGDGKGYATVEEAAQAALDGAAALGLPAPLLVWSGGGVQAYYLFKQAIEYELWYRLARALKKGLQSVGIRIDPTRTADSASIMRLPGSFNHNRGADAVIDLTRSDVRRHEAAEFERVLAKHGAAVHTASDNDKPVKQKSTRYHKHNKNAGLIVENCAQIRNFKETGSDSEPHWFDAASILATCLDGERLFHEWSSPYAGYSAEEAQAKFDAAIAKDAPRTCTKISECNDLCEGCIWKGHIKSPAELGVLKDKPAAPVTTPSGETIDFKSWKLPDHYRINKDHQLIREIGAEDGEVTEVLICDRPVHLVGIAKHEDEASHYVLMQQYSAAERGVVSKIIAVEELVGPQGLTVVQKFGPVVFDRGEMMDYLQRCRSKLNRPEDMSDLYTAFGWKKNSFLVGETLYTPEGPKPAALQPESFADAKRVELRPGGTARKGSLQGWKAAVLPFTAVGLEFQLDATVASFASVLMGVLAPTEGGVNRSYTSTTTGGGKTTASLLAQSVWGEERSLVIPPATSDITRNNIWSGAGHLPTFEDESNKIDPVQMKDRITAFTMGMNKIRSTQRGRVEADRARRSSIYITTSNTSTLAALSQYDVSDAMQARVFETQVPKLPGKVDRKLINAVAANPGWAGPIFLDYVVRNIKRVRMVLEAAEAELCSEFSTVELRYKVRYAACCVVAAAIINKLDLMRFDINRYIVWLKGEIGSKQEYAEKLDNAGYMRLFLDSIHDKTLTVVHGIVGGKQSVSIAPGTAAPKKEVAARNEETKQRLWLSRRSLNKFLAEHSKPPKEFYRWAHDAGYMPVVDSRKDLTSGIGSVQKGGEAVACIDLRKWKLDDVQD